MNHYDVIVIGGGQAGLAIGYHLAQQGRHFTILEAAPAPAAAWRERWDSLTLFTPARHDSLPGLPFPGDPDHYPTRDEVVAYLTDYARRFDLPIQYDSRVNAVRRQEEGYLVALDDRSYSAHERGVTRSPGLYFLGLPWQHTRGSALLGWVKDDAAHLAKRIETLRRSNRTQRVPS